MTDIGRLLLMLRRYWGWMALDVALLLATVLANVALLATSGWFIAAMGLAGLAGATLNYVTPAALIRVFAIMRTGGRYAERLVGHETTLRFVSDIRIWLLRRLEPLVPAAIGLERSAGLMARLRSDVERLEQVFLRLVAPVAVALASAITCVVAIASRHSGMALATSGLLVAAGVLGPLWLLRRGEEPGRVVARSGAALNVAAADLVEGLAELEAYGATASIIDRLEHRSSAVIAAHQDLARNTATATAGLGLAGDVALAASLALAVPAPQTGAIDGPVVIALAFLAWSAFETIAPMPLAAQSFGLAAAAARRVFALADQRPAVTDPGHPQEPPASSELRMEAVSVIYPGRTEPAIEAIDLTLVPGRRIGVIGESGSGKSTLILAATRLVAPSAGLVRLGGVDIATLNGEAVRARIAVAPQQVHLFTGTIAENLRIAKPGATRRQLEEVCAIAQIHDFVSAAPAGYDTFIGAAGLKLSGGQVRRLAVARALLKDAPIVILDEPTEGLDEASAQNLMLAIIEHCRNRALLVISHRTAGLDLLDELMVLDHGRLLVRGSPKVVLAGASGSVQPSVPRTMT